MNISLVTLTCASLVEIRLAVHLRIQTRSYADVVDYAEADWIRTKNNMKSSFGGGEIIRSRLADLSLRCPCYNVYTTGKGRQQLENWL